jgi:hypothetical protein
MHRCDGGHRKTAAEMFIGCRDSQDCFHALSHGSVITWTGPFRWHYRATSIPRLRVSSDEYCIWSLESESSPGMLVAASYCEIAAYGTLAALGKQLGQDQAVKLLLETLEEEKATDKKLTILAEQNVSTEAAGKS